MWNGKTEGTSGYFFRRTEYSLKTKELSIKGSPGKARTSYAFDDTHGFVTNQRFGSSLYAFPFGVTPCEDPYTTSARIALTSSGPELHRPGVDKNTSSNTT